MDIIRHLHHCPSGTAFFDRPATDGAHEDLFPGVSADLPTGWERTTGNGDWTVMTPTAARLPPQGWKIHVSATPDNARRVLDTVWKYCVTDEVTFKFLRSMQVLNRRNSKYGDRSASGKFITVYPVDEAHLERVLTGLGDLLEGETGPYILSDLRWKSGPLYVRYGGFVLRAVRSETGELTYCVEDPQGRLVPDVRGPGFRPPEWVRIPEFLAGAIDARNAGTLKDFPYQVTQALHFSNGGGVYRGTDTRTGTHVVLREARPLAGLDGVGRDAVARHEQEHWALRRLQGLPCIPRLIDYRIGHEHFFLVRDYVEGHSLSKEIMRRNPLVRGIASDTECAEYARWAQAVLDQIERGVRGMHDRGVVFGDLHPGNVLVGPDSAVSFIDFETASSVDLNAAQSMGAVGFMAPPGVTGTAVDHYALGCLRLAVYAPLAGAVPWGPGKVDQLIAFIRAHFPVPADFADHVYRDLGSVPHAAATLGTAPVRSISPLRPSPRQADWPHLRADIAGGILATADPARQDRLYPGDAEQFFTPEGGLNLAHGAAGVLWSLAETGTPPPEEHIDWLIDAVSALDDPRPGFYNGLSGIAYALDHLGRTDTAAEIIGRVARTPLETTGHSLYDGLSGIGLAQLHFARRLGMARLRDRALGIADRLTSRNPAASAARSPQPGLLRGESGSALLLLRLYEETGDTALLDHAEAALRRDLDRFGWNPEKPLPPEASGHIPLIASGCGGTGMVLTAYLGHRPDPYLVTVRDAIRAAADAPFLANAGLFHGRAGALLALLAMSGTDTDTHAAVQRHLDGFALHTVSHDGRPAFLGTECLRISTDLATGAAGVLLAVDAALTGRRSAIPFL